MKIMFISDIHGMKTNLPLIREKMKEFQCKKIVVLGDLYYVSPLVRMDKDYDPEAVQQFLNSFGDKLTCLNGNCDSDEEIDESPFPIMRGYYYLKTDGLDLYMTHGHLYNENNWDKENTILIFGHYHIPFIKEMGNNLYMNPGSISRPQDGFLPSYMIWDEKKFTIYDVNGTILAEKEMKK